MALCTERIGRGTITFQCSLTAPHDGPCATPESDRSMRERERWERDQAHQASGLGQFQGRAQTTAESLTENPTTPEGYRRDSMVRGLSEAESSVALDGETQVLGLPRRFLCGYHQHLHIHGPLDGHCFLAQPAPPRESSLAAHVAPTRTRPEDQPLPHADERQPVIHHLVQDDLQGRLEVGITRYGQGLRAFNGRNADQDAYEEVLDLAVYLRQRLIEREQTRQWLHELRQMLVEGTAILAATARTSLGDLDGMDRVLGALLDLYDPGWDGGG